MLQQRVFQAEHEQGGARIALAAAAAHELVVDAAGFVALGADDIEAAQRDHAGAEADVGATAGHVGGDGDGTELSGAGDDVGFAAGVFGAGVVEDLRGMPRLVRTRARASESSMELVPTRTGRSSLRMRLISRATAIPLFAAGAEDEIGETLAARRAMSRDANDGEAVDFAEFPASVYPVPVMPEIFS